MPPSTRIPPLLQSCVHVPRDDSLVLVTSTLGASANWLLVRFLCDALSAANASDGSGDDGHNVVLVSWMREFEFWKQEARKGAGLDLEKLRKEGRLAFVDGLSGLCLGQGQSGGPQQEDERLPLPRGTTALPARGLAEGRAVPGRNPRIPGAPVAQRTTPAVTTLNDTAGAVTSTPGLHILNSLDLTHLKTVIANAIAQLVSTSTQFAAQRRTFLILDNPDLLLALNPAITTSAMSSAILTLHTLPTVSHILTHMQSDTPLLSPSTPPQPLELAHHNLLIKMAHMSRRIVGVRVLDTGVARDVSGVVRVTEQRVGWLGLELGDGVHETNEPGGKGEEFLYQVKGDGSVRVFERGAGGEA